MFFSSFPSVDAEKNISAKKDSLWLFGLKFINSLAAIVYSGPSWTLHFREKPQTGLPSLLHCAPVA